MVNRVWQGWKTTRSTQSAPKVDMIKHLADIDDMLSQTVNVFILNTPDKKGPALNRELLRAADQNARAQFLV